MRNFARYFVWFLAGAICGVLTGCAGKPLVSIRDPNVYAQELDYNTMVQQMGATMMSEWMSEHCVCDSAKEWVDKDTEEPSELCVRSAKYALVVKYREPWHTEMARYNGSLTEERPMEEPPEVPEVSFLCEE